MTFEANKVGLTVVLITETSRAILTLRKGALNELDAQTIALQLSNLIETMVVETFTPVLGTSNTDDDLTDLES